MYAVFSKKLEEVYFAWDKGLVDMFLNDRCRSAKDFIVKKIDETKLTDKDMMKIDCKEIFEAYGVRRAIVPDEADFFDSISISDIYMMRTNLTNLIKAMNKLGLTKEELNFCNNVFERYNAFLLTIIEYECEEEECCYSWMEEFCILNNLYDKIIRNWTGIY